VAECANLPELLTSTEAPNLDAVVTDVRMPPMDGDEGVRAATAPRRSHPLAGVVVLPQYTETAYATACSTRAAAAEPTF